MELKVFREGSEVALPDGVASPRQVTIGTDFAADLTLEDENVAPRQVRLTRRGELWWAYDLEPAGGTQLNGAPLESGHLLQDQDALTLGAHEIRVELQAAEKAVAEAHRGAVDPGFDPKGRAHLRLETGQVYSLTRDSFLIGKDPSADLQLSGWNAPALGAVIVRGQEGHRLVNVAGAKVFHQSKPVELQVELKDGDRIEIRDLYASFKTGEAPRG